MAKDDGPETLGPSTSLLFHALAAGNKHIKNRKIVRLVSLYGHCVDALNLRLARSWALTHCAGHPLDHGKYNVSFNKARQFILIRHGEKVRKCA